MIRVLYFLLGTVTVMMACMLVRIVKGPTVFDRLNALGVVGTETILLILLLGYLSKRPDMYVDIAIAYALLGFISSVIIARYFGEKRS